MVDIATAALTKHQFIATSPATPHLVPVFLPRPCSSQTDAQPTPPSPVALSVVLHTSPTCKRLVETPDSNQWQSGLNQMFILSPSSSLNSTMTSPPGPQYHHNNQSRQNKNTSATLRYLPSVNFPNLPTQPEE
ncbi:hypothetical protein PtB15_8B609 [Puccinia triticina]|nr:hypothetical protein PtB15_8B609 [Puccinia triticina]